MRVGGRDQLTHLFLRRDLAHRADHLVGRPGARAELTLCGRGGLGESGRGGEKQEKGEGGTHDTLRKAPAT